MDLTGVYEPVFLRSRRKLLESNLSAFFVKDMNPRKRYKKDNDLSTIKTASKTESMSVKIACDLEECTVETMHGTIIPSSL